MADPKGFLKHGRETPVRRPPAERTHDWREFYEPLAEPKLKAQASRCMDCGVPFCQSVSTGCPVENLIPEWNDLVYRGRWKEALKALHATNNFPEMTGKLCPAPCESACVLGIGSDPVSIRSIESAIIDRGFAEGWVTPMKIVRKSGKRVAIVGSGPAGLAAAQQLARAGHSATVFERHDRVGGLLRYGIPDFKLEKSVLDRRLEQLSAEGVVFRVNQAITDVAALREEFDAVCITIGAEQPRGLPIPGAELGGVLIAMDYLIAQNRRGAGDTIPQEPSAKGKHVVILGGGDTGSDCLGTAHRQGAASVTQLELLPRPPDARDTSTPWPLWPLQLRSSHAHEEGGKREWSVRTLRFIGDARGVRALEAERIEKRGNEFVSVPGSSFELKADLAILALGFTGPVRKGLLETSGLALDPRGNVSVDAHFRTSVPGVFAAGDVKRGASLIVWAIAEGRKMADAVSTFLRERG